MTDERLDHSPWPLRPAILLALGIGCGIAFAALVLPGNWPQGWTENPARLALGSFVALFGIVFAFTLERTRWAWSLIFALASAAVIAGIAHWSGATLARNSNDGWHFVAALLALAIAAPLFQAARDEGSRRFSYMAVHAHAWTNIVLWFAAWAFVLIVVLLTLLLGELFRLIGIELLANAMEESWFVMALVGGGLGAAAGMLRDRDKVLGALQRVVTTVLAVLAPVLAIGLLLFVLALPFTGLEPLWRQTSATTPILLACVIGAIVLLNAVIGNSPEEAAGARVLTWSAMALAGVMLPLTIVAAISTGKRIAQHGFTPDRLWAATFIAIIAAIALTCLIALLLRRTRFAELVRPWNLRLAGGICATALLLATPLLDFGAISTRDQMARLRSGQVSPEKFDWAAMRFDFGTSGVRALERLREGDGDSEVRRLAGVILQAETRGEAFVALEEESMPRRPDRIIVRPAAVELPDELRRAVTDRGCFGTGECFLFWTPGATTAVAVLDGCAESIVGREAQSNPDTICTIEVTALEFRDGERIAAESLDDFSEDRISQEEEERGLRAERAALDAGRVEIRTVTRRQVFIGDRPVGNAFE